MNTRELLGRTGISAALLHRLIHAGLVGSAGHAVGSGRPRDFSPIDAEHIEFAAALILAGVKNETASALATQMQANGVAALGPFVIALPNPDDDPPAGETGTEALFTRADLAEAWDEGRDAQVSVGGNQFVRRAVNNPYRQPADPEEGR